MACSPPHLGPEGRGRLHLDAWSWRRLLELQGPSLGLWRAAEVAALREQSYEPPILDLGCGDGLVTAMVLPRPALPAHLGTEAHLGPEGRGRGRVSGPVDIGLDPDPRAIDRAAQTGIYQRLVIAIAEEADLPEESIGTVVSNSVLEHLAAIETVLATVARWLRPGGRLIFTAPTEDFSRWLALPTAGYAAWRNQQLGHLNLWPLEEWSRRLERVGLRIERIRPYLRRMLVAFWDVLELGQQIWIGRHRLISLLWRQIPERLMDKMAMGMAGLDLAAPAPGGGRLIVARKESVGKSEASW